MPSRSLGHRAPLLWVVLPTAAGLIAAHTLPHALPGVRLLLVLGLLAAVLAAAASFRGTLARAWPAAMLVAFFLAGAASYTLHRQRLGSWENLPPREARLTIRVERLFAQQDGGKASGLGRIVRAASPLAETQGQRLYFSLRLRPGEPSPRREATIVAAGVLAPVPRDAASDSFDGYLASSGVNFRFGRARLLGIEAPPPAYYRFCDRAAARFREILGVGIAEKRPRLAGLLRAMMLGETSDLTEEQHTIFMQSGTMHLFAISGLNIAVIAGALDALLRLARLGAAVRFGIGAVLLWLFVDITGAAPSAVRAFAMAVFFQGAFVLHRPANALAALVGSAAIVLVAAPLQLFSASFLMSYGIVFALLVLGVPLAETWQEHPMPWSYLPKATWTRWHRMLDASWRGTVVALAIGIATTLVGLLTSVQFFKLLTPGSFVANLVLIPAATVVTLGGFAALVCGLVGFTGGAILCNHASALVLLVIEALVRVSIRLPWAFVPAQFRAPWIGGTALGVLLLVLLAGYAGAWRGRVGWWAPFLVVALTLGFGVKFG